MESESIVRTIKDEKDGVNVSLLDKDEDQFSVSFDTVNILSNGWIECIGPQDSNPNERDYYPPERVIGLFASGNAVSK